MSLLEKLSERDRKVLLLGAVVSAVILLYIFAAEPLWNSYTGIKEEIPRVAGLVERYRAALANTESREKTTNFYKSEFERLKEATFIDDTDALATGQLSDIVRRAASVAGINLVSSTTERSESVTGFRILRLGVSFNSTLKNVAAFMKAIENSPKKILVKEVKMKSTKEAYGRYEPETLSVTMLISALRYMEKPGQSKNGRKPDDA